MFNFARKAEQFGHDKTELLTQNLMVAYAVENAEVGIYESLAQVASLAGDPETAALARSIQKQERETADKVWAVLAPAAKVAMIAARLDRAS